MARIDVIMPQMGESITEGTMSRWMKQVGDAVKRDEPIFEISTDKVDAEIPAPIAGVLAEVIVTEGQTVAVGTVVARIETEAGAAVAAPAAAAPAPAAPPAPSPAAPVAAALATPAPAPAPPAPPRAPAAAPPSGAAESAEERLRRKSTPLVRKMVEDHHLDLGAIPGSGSAGRVTKQDVLDFLDTGAPTVAPTTAASTPVAATTAQPSAQPRGPATAASPTVVPPSATVAAWEGDRVEPWSRIRKLTADHMVMSRRVSAHVNSLIEVDFSHVAQVRKRFRESFAERGVNLTFLAFIVKAIADNLRKHPVINAAVSGDNTIFRGEINVGIAVALDWGLIVPVIRHADELALLGIARSVQDLAERARTRKLAPEDVQKGTFTITNPGGFGTYVGTPIINQPQVAILAVGAIEKRPSVVTLPDGTDTIGVRTKGMMCLAYDHRVVDGADADKFLADVRKTLHTFPDHVG
ncbi:MAG TPA: dihydrolipoamide acetyltransferase family protein [Gemmatimonadales bacterium]|jgi:2-oxoglutarate dehydrogenase E2 component (dihydrolipoamide succinyltransferase)